MFSSLTAKAFEGMEKLVELNITAAKASLEESIVTAKPAAVGQGPTRILLADRRASPADR